ncbi:MAG TPA: plastocyanin/azurin family copper-binding protein [Vicinamibacterales bacterium]|nr:plastocyanin/azurin family copper-binding protein [Vicinamibacterales bacterium]
MAHPHVPQFVRVLRHLAAVSLLTACATSPDSKTSANTTVDVFTVVDAFSPAFVTVSAGDTVRWTFSGGSDGMGHNVRFAAGVGAPPNIDILKTGTATRVFLNRGTYNYFCDVHPGMNGGVTVQ